MTATLAQRIATIIVTIAVALFTLFALHSCDDNYFGRPPDAYSFI